MSYNQQAAYNRLHIFNNDMTLKLKAAILDWWNEKECLVEYYDLTGEFKIVSVTHDSSFNEREEIAYSNIKLIVELNEEGEETDKIYAGVFGWLNDDEKLLISTIEYLIEEKLHEDFQAKCHEQIAKNAEDHYEYKMNGGW